MRNKIKITEEAENEERARELYKSREVTTRKMYPKVFAKYVVPGNSTTRVAKTSVGFKELATAMTPGAFQSAKDPYSPEIVKNKDFGIALVAPFKIHPLSLPLMQTGYFFQCWRRRRMR